VDDRRKVVGLQIDSRVIPRPVEVDAADMSQDGFNERVEHDSRLLSA